MANDKFIAEYRDRLLFGQDTYAEKYKEMHYAEMAYRGEIPSDIKDAIINTDDDNSNFYLAPVLTFVVDALKKELSVNDPHHILKGNNRNGKKIVREYMDKIGEIFSKHNWGHNAGIAYHYGLVKGTIVSETIFKPIVEYVIPADAEAGSVISIDPISQMGGVDFVSYDPALVVPDPDADPLRFSETAKWCIVTKGYYTPERIKDIYKVDVPMGKFGSTLGSLYNMDEYNKMEKLKAGVDMYQGKGTVPVRDYYLTDGRVYTIINDSIVMPPRINHIGAIGKIPINICPLKPDPHCVFGFTWWGHLKNSIALLSRVINQVLDNNDYNNNFPLVTFSGTIHQLSEIKGRKILEINPLGEKMDIGQMIQKIPFPEISQGAMFLQNLAFQMIQFMTGITPASMGMQTKQMRVAGEANIISNAILTNSSEIVRSIETSYINRCVWDTMKIFYRYFDSFNFKMITKDFLKNHQDVHVANGSTLAGDKITAQQLSQFKLQLLAQYPQLMDALSVIDESLRAFGDHAPDTNFRTPEQIQQTPQALQLAAMQNVDGGGL